MPKLEYMVPADAGNPEWANKERTQINITVSFPHLGGEEVRYTAAKSDPGWEHSEEIFERAAAGEFGKVAPFKLTQVPVLVSPVQLNKGLILSGTRARLREKLAEDGLTQDEIDVRMADVEYIWEPVRNDDARVVAALDLLGMSPEERENFWKLCASL